MQTKKLEKINLKGSKSVKKTPCKKNLAQLPKDVSQ
jgi:hypothetical protein